MIFRLPPSRKPNFHGTIRHLDGLFGQLVYQMSQRWRATRSLASFYHLSRTRLPTPQS